MFQAINFNSIPLILRSVAYDLTYFMKVFDFGQTWSTFVYNSVFNGTMFQGVKFRVDSTNSQVCSLRFDLFHEEFEFGSTWFVFVNNFVLNDSIIHYLDNFPEFVLKLIRSMDQ